MAAAILYAAQFLSFGLSTFRTTSCECHCSSDPSASVLALLGEQLARCGPENLARVCPAAAAAPWYPGVAFALLLISVGFIAGAAAATLGIQREVGSRCSVATLPVYPEVFDRTPLALSATAAADSRGPLTPSAKRATAPAYLRHGGSSLLNA
jgi:hypothetical protein